MAYTVYIIIGVIAGQPNTSGLLGRKNIIAEEDADAVALFRQAGIHELNLQ